MRNDKENIIVKRTLDFALKIIEFVELLKKSNHYSLADQIFRSGLSIGANVREAQNAESKADFIHKMKIAAKEADELDYYLELCKQSALLIYNENMHNDLMEIIKMQSKIIASSKKPSFLN